MLDAGERAYAYTKACGIIGKSFIGKRIPSLAALRTLSELDRLVFPERRHDLPGRELLGDLENRIVQRAIDSICVVIRSYQKPPKALVRLLQSFEYADLKTCLHYLAEGKRDAPSFSHIGDFGSVKFEKYPDLRLMLADTEFDFLPEKIPEKCSDADLAALETELDLRYYALLIKSLYELSGEDRKIACMILSNEISLRNCVWAFRLRSYFKMTEDEAGKHLMDITMRLFSDDDAPAMRRHISSGNIKREVSLAAEAFESLDKPLDQRSAWKGWRWEKFLNPETPARAWEADPRYFQNAASYYLYRLALSHFHTMPFSVSAIFCYIKLKQFEEDLLTSVSEGLALGMSPADVLSLLEVSR
jgi:vacuolar-type H+-ATPase subunit C/Vma6